MLTKAAFVWSKISKYHFITIYNNYFLFFIIFKMQFIPVMAKMNFQQPLLQSLVSRDYSEVILISNYPRS